MSIQLLTAPGAIAQPTQSKRFMVELTSNTLDWEGVPESVKKLDVCVVEPTLEAIAVFLKAVGYLDGWRIVSHWVPESCDCF